jgi:hypothetical protein
VGSKTPHELDWQARTEPSIRARFDRIPLRASQSFYDPPENQKDVEQPEPLGRFSPAFKVRTATICIKKALDYRLL